MKMVLSDWLSHYYDGYINILFDTFGPPDGTWTRFVKLQNGAANDVYFPIKRQIIR